MGTPQVQLDFLLSTKGIHNGFIFMVYQRAKLFLTALIVINNF